MGYLPSHSSKKTEGTDSSLQNLCQYLLRCSTRQNRNRSIFLCIIVGSLFVMLHQVKLVMLNYVLVTDISKNFSYPSDLQNFTGVVEQFRLGTLDERIAKPINLRYSEITFSRTAISPSDFIDPVGLLIIVKSATRNYAKRKAVRKTWGDPSYLKRNSLQPNLPTKLVFICGIPKDRIDDTEELFPNEGKYNDIVLADFEDTYSNNTYKSILALKWALKELPTDFKYLFLVDDDMYVDLENIIHYLQMLPEKRAIKDYQDTYKPTLPCLPYLRLTTMPNDSVTEPALKNGLYLGSVCSTSIPVRVTLWSWYGVSEKWYVSLADYPYNLYPPYHPGAGLILDKKVVSDFYYASFFVQHFWIDDVYLGILAYKMGILPLHNGHFHSGIDGVKTIKNKDRLGDAMTLHGFKCPSQMVDLWKTRNLNNLFSC